MNKVACLLLLAAFTVPTLGQTGSDKPFTIEIAAEHKEVRAGSDVWIKVSLTNKSSRDLDMSGGINMLIGLDPNYIFEVRDERGDDVPKRVYPHPELATGVPVNRIVKPQETFTEDQRISALYDIRKPGKYTITVSRRVSDNPKDGYVKSNQVTVTVVPQTRPAN